MFPPLSKVAGAVRALRLRWPNPILATVGVGGPFNGLPRFPFQVGECVSRTLYFVRSSWNGRREANT